MKRTLLLATALTASLVALAQNPIVPVEFQGRYLDTYVPKAFADAPYLVRYEGDDLGNVTSFSIFNHNLQQVSTIPVNGRVEGLTIYNYDEEFMYEDDARIQLTQTLFNSDSRFEYIKPIKDGEGNCIRFDVVADDGTVVNTFGNYAGMGYRYMWMCLHKIANTVYLQVQEDYGNVNELYRIDRQTANISRVEGLPFNVFPTVADRESTITVQFEEGATATELQVLDAQGRTVQRIPVAPGQQEVKVSTRGLRSGVGFIGDRRHGAAKIIVR